MNGFYIIATTVAMALLFASCSNDQDDIPIPVSGVTVDLSTAILDVNKTITLTASIQPADAFNQIITWTSSNTGVASIDNYGVVTAHAPGTATITATTQDGSFTASCNVTVKTLIIPVAEITLNKLILSFVEGDSETLIASVLPDNATNKTVMWESSNDKVATVSNNGKVTAIAPGATTITVTTEDGGKTASCAVTVAAAIVHVTGVTLNRTSLALDEGKSFTCIATILPENATNKTVTWISSSRNVASVDNRGVVRGVSSGTATITVTTQDGNKTATCVITVQPCGCGW
jgi:uncharacterized protein YjdB